MITVTKSKNWSLYWGAMPLPVGAEALGLVKRENLETGALIRLANGNYVQGNAGGIRSLPQSAKQPQGQCLAARIDNLPPNCKPFRHEHVYAQRLSRTLAIPVPPYQVLHRYNLCKHITVLTSAPDAQLTASKAYWLGPPLGLEQTSLGFELACLPPSSIF